MFKLEQVLLLKEDERVRAIVRRHGLALIPGLALALPLIVAPFFFLFPLFKFGPAGIAVFSVSVFAGLIVALRTLVMWDGDVFIVTSLRVVDVDQRGLFARTVSEVKLEDIQDVSWSKNGLLDALFKVGTLKVQTYSGALVIEARFIPRPQDLHNLVNDLRHAIQTDRQAAASSSKDANAAMPDARLPDGQGRQAKNKSASPERQEKVKRLTEHLAALNDEELARLERSLKRDDRDLAIQKLFGAGEDPKLKPLDEKI